MGPAESPAASTAAPTTSPTSTASKCNVTLLSLTDSLGLFYVLDLLPQIVTESLGAYQIPSSSTCTSPVRKWCELEYYLLHLLHHSMCGETFLCKTYFHRTLNGRLYCKYIKNQLVDRDSFVR